MRKPSLTLLLVAVPALAIPSAASAVPAGSVPANCWGVVTSQFARADRGIGEHSSSQTNPRLGLGNVAKALFDQGLISDPHVSDLGALLAQLDEFDETVCPVQQP
jgi:hypothetical protein